MSKEKGLRILTNHLGHEIGQAEGNDHHEEHGIGEHGEVVDPLTFLVTIRAK